MDTLVEHVYTYLLKNSIMLSCLAFHSAIGNLPPPTPQRMQIIHSQGGQDVEGGSGTILRPAL